MYEVRIYDIKIYWKGYEVFSLKSPKNMRNLKEVRKRIDKNYNCIKQLEKSLVEQNSDIEKLELLSLIGCMYSEYVTGLYSSDFLEKEIVKIGNKIEFKADRQPRKNHILHVMTRAYNVGGHSVIVNNWMKWDAQKVYSVVFTDTEYYEIPIFIRESVLKSGGKIYCLRGNYIEKAKTLLELSQDFERIILHTHMHDVVPVLAYSNVNWKIPVYLYNHADFRFSYGYTVADKVLNLNEYDKKKTTLYRGVEETNSVLLEFPGMGDINPKKREYDKKKLRKELAKKYNFDENEKLIVSMGADFKYKSIIGYKFEEYVLELIKKNNYKANFIIIGAEPGSEKWKKLYKVTNGKAKAIGIIPREEAELLIGIGDLYIVSFPMLAAGAMIAENAGVPYLLLSIINRSSEYYEANSVKTVKELIEKSMEVLNGNGQNYLGSCRKKMLLQDEWCDYWHKICNDSEEHKIQEINPNRYIKRQEYVNCQLMQEEAGKKIRRYIKTNTLSFELQKKLLYLDKKYEMNIYKEDIEKEEILFFWEKLYDEYIQIKKKLNNYREKNQILKLWMKIKEDGKKIDEYLYNNGYKTVAIYGMYDIGRLLEQDIRDSKIQVKYGIDRNAEHIQSRIKIYKAEDVCENVDLIINTSRLSEVDIKTKLKINADVISIQELLIDM